MKDKILFGGAVLLIAISVFQYDAYVREKGGMGPVGKMAKFLGYDQKETKPKIIEKSLQLGFDFQAREAYRALNSRLDQIQNEKKQIIASREEIINRLLDLNNELVDEANIVLKSIDEKRRPFINYKNELRLLSDDLIETHKISDSELRRNKYRIIENQLKNNIQKTLRMPTEDVRRINNILYTIEQIVMESGDLYINDCDSYEECTEKRKESLDAQITRIFEPTLKMSGRQIEKFIELLRMWEYEYLLQLDGLEQNQLSDKTRDQKINGALQKIMNQLIRITPNDLKDMIYIYKAVANEQRERMAGLGAREERWRTNVIFIHDQVKRLLSELRVSTETDFSKLDQKFNELNDSYLSIIEELKINDEQFRQILKHQTYENKHFLVQLAKFMQIDMKRLADDIAYAEGVNNTYIKYRNHMKRKRK